MSSTEYIAVAEFLASSKASAREFNDLFEKLADDESIENDEYYQIYDKIMRIYKTSF